MSEGFANAPASKVLILAVLMVSVLAGLCDPAAVRGRTVVPALLSSLYCPTASTMLLAAVLVYGTGRVHERVVGTQGFLAEGFMAHVAAFLLNIAMGVVVGTTTTTWPHVDGPHTLVTWLCVTHWATYPSVCNVAIYPRLLTDQTALALLFLHYVTMAPPDGPLPTALAVAVDTVAVAVCCHMRSTLLSGANGKCPRWVARWHGRLCAFLTASVLPSVQPDSCLWYQVWK